MKMIIATLIIGSMVGWPAYGQNSNGVLGTWLSEKKTARIQVYRQKDKLYGKIVWVQDASTKDVNNPDEKLRNRPLIGLNLLSDFEEDGENTWSGGKIYDPESGKTYSCKMTLKGNTLEIRGYVGLSMFGRTSVWTRI